MRNQKALLQIALIAVAALCSFAACAKEDDKATALFSPDNVRVTSDEVLTWDAVDGADGYEVSFDDVTYYTKENSLDIFFMTVDPYKHVIKVRATAEGGKAAPSAYSETIYYTAPTGSGIGANLISEKQGYMIKAMGEVGKKLIIPNEIDGKPVTRILTYAFSNEQNLKAVYVPDGVKEIRNYAFANCTSLEYVRLPDELEMLNSFAFQDCTSLKTVVMPSFAERMGDRLFRNCTSLEKADIPENRTGLSANMFEGCTAYRDLYIGKNIAKVYGISKANCFEHITVDEENEYYYSKDDCVYEKQSGALVLTCKNSVISNDTKAFALYAFSGRKDLVEFSVPDSVESIGDNCFEYCTALKTITFSSSLNSIGVRCFGHCYELESINIPQTNDKYCVEGDCLIETQTATLVQGCKNSVIPQTVETIGEYAFYTVGLKSITMPANVKKICDYAFTHNYELNYLALRNGLEYIGEDAFRYCYTLDYVSIPRTVTHIGDRAFAQVCCSVALPIEIEPEYIGEGSFAGCTLYAEAAQSRDMLLNIASAYGSPITIVCSCEFAEEDGVYYIDCMTVDAFCSSSKITASTSCVQIPQRKGYVFKGWAYEENGENNFTFYVINIWYKYPDSNIDWGYEGVGEDGSRIVYVDENTHCINAEDGKNLIENYKGERLYAIWVKE